jgi:hypothetical protein
MYRVGLRLRFPPFCQKNDERMGHWGVDGRSGAEMDAAECRFAYRIMKLAEYLRRMALNLKKLLHRQQD